MAPARYLTCPVCDADVPLAGDERVKDSLVCPYCEVPLVLRKKTGTEDIYLEEDT